MILKYNSEIQEIIMGSPSFIGICDRINTAEEETERKHTILGMAPTPLREKPAEAAWHQSACILEAL